MRREAIKNLKLIIAFGAIPLSKAILVIGNPPPQVAATHTSAILHTVFFCTIITPYIYSALI